MQGLDCDERSGRPIAGMANAVLAISVDYPELWRDDRRGLDMLGDEPVDDDTLNTVRRVLDERYRLVLGSGLAADAIAAVCAGRRRHELRSALLALTWDGVSRLRDVARLALHVTDPGPEGDMIRAWIIGAVVRVLKPG
jgi:predicted P-loop ATPase